MPPPTKITPATAAAHLADLRAYVAAVLEACDTDTTAGLATPELEALRLKARRVADEFALRYAVAGDCNAGKSLLTAALLGLAGAVRADQSPETGNVTVLRLTDDGPAGAVAKLGSFRLTFFTADEARDCLRALAEAAAQELDRSQAVGPARELRAAAAAPVAGHELLDWTGREWAALPSGPAVRNRLIELARFCAAWVLYQVMVTRDGTQVAVEEKTARAAMRLPDDAISDTTDTPTSTATLKAILESAKAEPLTAWPADPGVDLARGCYPLIREVRIDVKVSKEVWDFGPLPVAAVELFDFPGLRASSTAARDAYLSERERTDDRVHAWLVVLNAANLSGTMATELIRDLLDGRVLAVANQFDRLLSVNEGNRDLVSNLGGPDAPPPGPAEVLRRVGPLGTVYKQLSELAPAEWTVVASAFLGLAELDEAPAFRHKVLTDDQRGWWADTVASGNRTRAALGRLAPLLSAGGTPHPLGAWLAEYARPGGQAGVAYLRRRLADHARGHGLIQMAVERDAAVRRLRTEVRVCVDGMSQAARASRQAADEVRAALAALEREISNGALDGGALDDLPADDGPTIRELVGDAVLAQVYGWPQWKALFDATGAEGYVEYTPAPADDGLLDELGLGSPTVPPPMRAGDLLPAYQKAYQAVERDALARVRELLLGQLRQVARRLTADALRPLRDALPHLPDDLNGRLIRQVLALDGQAVGTALLRPLQPAADRPEVAAQRFPFLLPAGPDLRPTLGPYFGWAPERLPANTTAQAGSRERKPSYHQTAVFRLRHELATSLAANVLRHLTGGLEAFHRGYAKLIQVTRERADHMQGLPSDELLDLFGRGGPVGPAEPRPALADVPPPPPLPLG